VDELRHQLKEVGGDASKPDGTTYSDQEFPSIRQLPLLEVRWADLYRDNKIQETLYELLSEQYEIAKIEEAKETPVVKVLDQAVVPERKSGPPRLVIVLFGAATAFAAAALTLLSNAAWHRMDPESPTKQLGEEVLASFLEFGSLTRSRWRMLLRKEP
jgi:hypothetical protein